MIELKHRTTGAVLYRADSTRIAQAVQLAVMARADLTGANLTGADLADANLTGVNLADANLTGVDLTGADLTHANLTGADLTDANLADANLTRAYLTGAYLIGADLTGAYGTPLSISGSRHTILGISREWVAIGCKTLPLCEWLALYQHIGKSEAYTTAQIAEYGIYLQLVATFFDAKDRIDP